MKNSMLLFAALIITPAVFAQPDVTSAFNANEDGKYEDAMMYIEKAMNDPKATAKEKTWRYRGDIYLNVAKDPELSAKYPQAVSLAAESFRKAIELDSDNYNFMDNRKKCDQLLIICNNQGIDRYNNNDFRNAAAHFEQSIVISNMFEIIDTLSIYNAAYCHQKAGDADKALAGYLRCGELGYNVPDVYIFSSGIEQKKGNAEAALKIITDARLKYPDSKALLIEEITLVLQAGNYAEAEKNLAKAIADDPNNEVLHFALGTVYEKFDRFTDAENAYKKAIEIKPDYFDALFNLGATYFNRGVEQFKMCDEIPASRTAEYNDCLAKSTMEFQRALPHLQAAHKADPTDKITMRSLKETYTRLDMHDQAARIKAILGEE